MSLHFSFCPRAKESGYMYICMHRQSKHATTLARTYGEKCTNGAHYGYIRNKDEEGWFCIHMHYKYNCAHYSFMLFVISSRIIGLDGKFSLVELETSYLPTRFGNLKFKFFSIFFHFLHLKYSCSTYILHLISCDNFARIVNYHPVD